MSYQVWSARDFSLLKTLAGHEGRIMAVDCASHTEHLLASVSYDRTLKLWRPDAHEQPALMEVEVDGT
jgi:U4/U6 small nuclear ribonucleoprotein PRP4